MELNGFAYKPKTKYITLYTTLQEDRLKISLGMEQTPTGDFQSDVNFVSKLPFMSTNSVEAFKLIHNKSAEILGATEFTCFTCVLESHVKK